MSIFVIEDEMHSEWCGEFSTYEDAFNELRGRAKIPWDSKPNICPCKSWKQCGRNYEIIEFNNSKSPWEEIQRTSVLEISAKGATWLSP